MQDMKFLLEHPSAHRQVFVKDTAWAEHGTQSNIVLYVAMKLGSLSIETGTVCKLDKAVYVDNTSGSQIQILFCLGPVLRKQIAEMCQTMLIPYCTVAHVV